MGEHPNNWTVGVVIWVLTPCVLPMSAGYNSNGENDAKKQIPLWYCHPRCFGSRNQSSCTHRHQEYQVGCKDTQIRHQSTYHRKLQAALVMRFYEAAPHNVKPQQLRRMSNKNKQFFQCFCYWFQIPQYHPIPSLPSNHCSILCE